MIHALDHVVILVEQLASAIAAYTAAGFVVAPGGEHADGATHNALISFPDGTYLELIAFRRPAPEHRWWRHVAAGPGLIDFALLPINTTIAVAMAADRGLMMNGPVHGGRIRPDGISLAWETAWPPSPDLPFLCGDVTDRAYRVPDADFWGHSNGAKGIAEVVVAVTDLVASVGRYAALLGVTPQAFPAEARIRLGESEIVLRSPDAGDPHVLDRLTRRGEGICAITLKGLQFPDLSPQLGAAIMAAPVA
ncbi:MAG: hypothetical protein KatS3mg055_2490 [Chloroflexus sp.]|uniref:VOC family protein n=1 Tax=Chloroflexus sp. TaxID=1904827 RepID=UPI0021DD6148|nr:VOC family protein [Chloroflexus sp.]GIV89972.1 MAG: hypothetical protein KatS3mg055_2490 [Chloroflexus sp.]